jgi:hypothetical protein
MQTPKSKTKSRKSPTLGVKGVKAKAERLRKDITVLSNAIIALKKKKKRSRA